MSDNKPVKDLKENKKNESVKKFVAQNGKALPLRINGKILVIGSKEVEIDLEKIDHSTKRIIKDALKHNDIKECK